MAPLKRRVGAWGWFRLCRFPRLQKRGPIEAPGGLAAVDHRLERFPRLQKRGPIEAEESHCPPTWSACFHAYKSVAPLKQRVGHAGHVSRAGGFHAYKSVAPLKPNRCERAVHRAAAWFPRLQTRGPIEASTE